MVPIAEVKKIAVVPKEERTRTAESAGVSGLLPIIAVELSLMEGGLSARLMCSHHCALQE